MTNNQDQLRIAREALKQIAETPTAGWIIAHNALAQLDRLVANESPPDDTQAPLCSTDDHQSDDDLVQVVARAICRADPEVRMGDAYGVVEQRVYIEWHRYGWQARAALSALDLPARLQAAKDAGREEAAGIATAFDGKPCGPAQLWTDEQREFFDCGQIDASSSITQAIRERIGKP